ncbi:MAG TPA: PIN domain-containing protein [Solirubrobacterales bacterium]|nr:PIN domain-containing protein [Solirubrobacterales bacterium]
MLLVDASVWVCLVEDESPHREAAASLIREQTSSLSALDLTLYEVANAIGVKRGDTQEASRVNRLLLRCCRDRVLSVEAELVNSAMQIAAEHGLTVYDAAYVAAARRNGLTLVSTDIRDLVSKGLAVTPDAAVYP